LDYIINLKRLQQILRYNFIISEKRHPPVPQSEKVLTRFSQVGTSNRTSTFPHIHADLVYSV